MKKILLFVLLGFTVMFTACTKKDVVSFKSYTIQKHIVAPDSMLDFSLKAIVELPVGGRHSKVLKNISDDLYVSLFGNQFVGTKNDAALPSYTDSVYNDFKMGMEDLHVPDSNRIRLIYEENLAGNVAYMNDSILSYSIDLYVFAGGAHGLDTKTDLVYDLTTGKRLTEDDIFGSTQLDSVSAILRMKVDSLRDDKHLPKELDEIFSENIKPNGNFKVIPEGIEYTFNPYEIAPYVYGRTTVLLHSYEIMPYLNKNSVVYKFFSKTK